jgi:hypothetical protein
MGVMEMVPEKLQDITADWLSKVLQRPLNSIKLTSMSGDGPGYMSDMCFVDIDSDDESTPSRLVAKSNPTFEAAAAFANRYNVFEREAWFYREIAPISPIRTPEVFFAETNAKGVGLILLQDCSHYETRPALSESPPELELTLKIVTSLAIFHAHWWDSSPEALSDYAVHPHSDNWSKFITEACSGWPQVLTSDFAQFLPIGSDELISEIMRHYTYTFTKGMPEKNWTLLHSDFHIDNLFFDFTQDDPVIAFDWSFPRWGKGAQDLAYFIAYIHSSAHHLSIEKQVLDQYYATLIKNGVEDYERSQLQEDYEQALLYILYIIPIAISNLDLSTEHGMKVGKKVIENFMGAALDHNSGRFLVSED